MAHASSAIAVLISQAAEAADVDRISFIRTLRLARRSATGTRPFPLRTGLRPSPPSTPRSPPSSTPPGATAPAPARVKRARHNSYRVKKPGETATRHDGPATIRFHTITPRAA